MDEILRQQNIDVTINGEFDRNLFRQPCLVIGDIKPAAYRNSMINTELKNFGIIESEAYHADEDFLQNTEIQEEIDELLNDSPSKKLQHKPNLEETFSVHSPIIDKVSG